MAHEDSPRRNPRNAMDPAGSGRGSGRAAPVRRAWQNVRGSVPSVVAASRPERVNPPLGKR
jgi:hypothetical protein